MRMGCSVDFQPGDKAETTYVSRHFGHICAIGSTHFCKSVFNIHSNVSESAAQVGGARLPCGCISSL